MRSDSVAVVALSVARTRTRCAGREYVIETEKRPGLVGGVRRWAVRLVGRAYAGSQVCHLTLTYKGTHAYI
jgi:hypothetical protein